MSNDVLHIVGNKRTILIPKSQIYGMYMDKLELKLHLPERPYLIIKVASMDNVIILVDSFLAFMDCNEPKNFEFTFEAEEPI
jgi:hypothetical protein